MSDWLLFLHILAAMLWVGGNVVLSVVATRILRSERGAVGRFVATLRVVGPLVLAPASMLVLVTGIWQVADDDAWGFGQTWVWLALVLLAAAFLIGAVFQSRAAIGAERASSAGDHDEAARQLGRWTWGSAAILLLLVVATWDMVFKPGL
jgi:uncharacterized membrane protein